MNALERRPTIARKGDFNLSRLELSDTNPRPHETVPTRAQPPARALCGALRYALDATRQPFGHGLHSALRKVPLHPLNDNYPNWVFLIVAEGKE